MTFQVFPAQDPLPEAPMIVKPAPENHYTWGEHCDGWKLTSGHALSVIEERMPPSTSETSHHHRDATQFFRVLKGVLILEVEGERYSLKAGEGLEVSPGERHKAINASPQPCVFLVCSAPSTEGDRIEAKSR